MKITPIIGHWYLAGNGTSRYIIRLDKVSDSPHHKFFSDKWRVFQSDFYNTNQGGFNELLEEIDCPEEFKPKIVNTLIFN